MDPLAAIGIPPEFGDQEDEDAKKKKKPKKMTAKKLKKLLVKQQEEARAAAIVSKQKYLEETKERVQREWAINKAKIQVYEEEQQRRIQNLTSTFEQLSYIEENWQEFIKQKRSQQEWLRYMKCDRLPDPIILPQINTYKFLWTEVENDASMAYCLQKTDEVMKLLKGLDDTINDPGPECTPSLLESWRNVRNDMRNLLQSQIDKTTYKLFRRIETDMDPVDVTTSQYYTDSKYFAMHLWAELITPIPSTRATETRHPLHVDFLPSEVSVVLPVSLLDIHKVIRVMQMRYDHWSDRCRSYDCPAPPENYLKDLLHLTVDELETRTEIVNYRETLEEKMKKRIANVPPQPTLSQEIIAWDSEPQRVLSEEIAFREYEEEEIWKSRVKKNLNEYEINLRERLFLGGLILLEVLHQPPQPKYLRYKHDVTVLVEPPHLSPVQFRKKFQPSLPELEVRENEDEKKFEERKAEHREICKLIMEAERQKLIAVKLRLPQTVVWSEKPEIAVWDSEAGYWTSEYVHETEFKEDDEVVSFRIGILGLVGLHVNRFCNFPYQDWSMESDFNGGVNFHLTAAKIDMNFHIKNDQVCVSNFFGYQGKPIDQIENVYMEPKKLAQYLKSFGIDVFPELDASCYLPGTTPKHIVCERHLYQIWGLFSTSFCFKSSKFNRNMNRRNSIFQIKEEHLHSDFCLVKSSPSEAYIMDITEKSEVFSQDPVPGSEVYTDIYNLITKNCTHKARRTAEHTSYVLIQTIRDLLALIRPLSFS